MKNKNLVSAGDLKTVSLSELVENSAKRYLLTARLNHNSLVNNVNNKMKVLINETIVGSVISGLIHSLITHTRESQVYISAKELYGNMIEVNVKDDNCLNTYAVALSLQDVVPLAEKIGGKLNITNKRQKITTISFTFPLVNTDETGVHHD